MAAEADIEVACVDLAERAGWESRKLKWIGQKAAPDRIFFGFGRCVLIEFKDEGVRLRGLQKRKFRNLRKRYKDLWAVWEIETFRVIMNIPEHIR